ncbi:MAG: hypothetical protein FD138_1023, partial [Planctomycetota bacterium]
MFLTPWLSRFRRNARRSMSAQAQRFTSGGCAVRRFEWRGSPAEQLEVRCLLSTCGCHDDESDSAPAVEQQHHFDADDDDSPTVAEDDLGASPTAEPSDWLAALPLRFEQNVGQVDSAVRFLSHGLDYELALTSTDAVLMLTQRSDDSATDGSVSPIMVPVAMHFVGANQAPAISGQEELITKTNYLGGAQSFTDVANFGSVLYDEVYAGIDVVYRGSSQNELEYDLIVAPGADPDVIRVEFSGAEHLELDDHGDLLIHTAAGTVRQEKPVSYQEVDGERQEVASRFVLNGNEVNIDVGEYDHARTLVIDPIQSWTRRFGEDAANLFAGEIAVDPSGNVYVTGQIFRNLNGRLVLPTFPLPTADNPNPVVQSLPIDGEFGPVDDAYVLKFNANQQLVYATFLGSTGSDAGLAIVGDEEGNAYVGGRFGFHDFPGITDDVIGQRGFIAKLNPTGSQVLWVNPVQAGVSDLLLQADGSLLAAGGNYSGDHQSPWSADHAVGRLEAGGEFQVDDQTVGAFGHLTVERGRLVEFLFGVGGFQPSAVGGSELDISFASGSFTHESDWIEKPNAEEPEIFRVHRSFTATMLDANTIQMTLALSFSGNSDYDSPVYHRSYTVTGRNIENNMLMKLSSAGEIQQTGIIKASGSPAIAAGPGNSVALVSNSFAKHNFQTVIGNDDINAQGGVVVATFNGAVTQPASILVLGGSGQDSGAGVAMD